jgi:hypothetical protein
MSKSIDKDDVLDGLLGWSEQLDSVQRTALSPIMVSFTDCIMNNGRGQSAATKITDDLFANYSKLMIDDAKRDHDSPPMSNEINLVYGKLLDLAPDLRVNNFRLIVEGTIEKAKTNLAEIEVSTNKDLINENLDLIANHKGSSIKQVMEHFDKLSIATREFEKERSISISSAVDLFRGRFGELKVERADNRAKEPEPSM